MAICNHDCFNCWYERCVSNSGITDDEIAWIEDEDSVILSERRNNPFTKKFNTYNHSDKGIERARRYNSSDKGRKRDKMYKQSDKGKKVVKNAQNKRNDIEWLERYERIYAGTSKNTDKRRWKAARIRKKYGIKSCYNGRHKKSAI